MGNYQHPNFEDQITALAEEYGLLPDASQTNYQEARQVLLEFAAEVYSRGAKE